MELLKFVFNFKKHYKAICKVIPILFKIYMYLFLYIYNKYIIQIYIVRSCLYTAVKF